MKYKPILFLITIFLSGAIYAQQVTEIEYFFNSDPGLGNGTAVSFTPAAVVETSFTANTSSINPGVNNLFVRAKDNTNQWSLYSKRTIYIINGTFANAPDITEIEYFFDEDPGFGSGTSYSFTPDSIVELSFATDLSNLTPGIHNLFVRAKDGLDRWSIYSKRTLYIIQGNVIDMPEVTAVEYFIDDDPGFGEGTAVPITPAAIAEFTFTTDLSGLTPGIHNIFVRAKDELDRWSLYTKKTIYVMHGSGSITPPDIVAIEYFFDDDPGFWNGISVPLSEFNDTIEMAFEAEVVGLTVGEHFLYVRAMDANMRWSLYSMDTVNVEDYQYDIIELEQGWSGISSYIEPADAAIENMFSGIESQLIILQNDNGMYWPGQNVNTLGNWNMESGYSIKVTGNVELSVSGSRTENHTLQMSPQWNLIPVLSECAVDVEDLFAANGVVIVKEVAGWRTYWPEFGINTLQVLEPGKAYFALMSSEEEIEFPECETPSNSPLRGRTGTLQNGTTGQCAGTPPPPGGGREGVYATPISHTIALPVSAIGNNSLAIGDIIGVFDVTGSCFGMAEWNGENTALTLYGDDPTTPAKDGFTEGELLMFKLLEKETGQEHILEVAFDENFPNSDLSFHNNGLSALASLKVSPTGTGEFSTLARPQIIPNPAKDEFILKLTNVGQVEGSMRIRALDGRPMGEYKIQYTETSIDVSSLKAGVYLLEINVNDTSFVDKLIKR